jgi:predicted anti-sigma-YlaC factor YlaD
VNCRAAHDLLHKRLDGVPVESPELSEHLRGCSECRALAAATRRFQEGLHLMTPPTPPPDLAERIVERILRDRRRTRSRARRRLAVSLALAAGLFIALVYRLDWRVEIPQERSRNRETIAAKPTSSATTPPTLGESVREAREAVAALTTQAAGETVERTRWLVKVSRSSLPDVPLAPALDPPTEPLRQAGEGVSEGLEPVTNSARRAIDLFLRELPLEGGREGW